MLRLVLLCIALVFIRIILTETPPIQPRPRTHWIQPQKTLVVLIGNVRGGEYAWKSLIANVLRENVDLALCVTEPIPDILRDAATFIWPVPEHDWGKVIDDACTHTNWRSHCLIENQYLGGACNHTGSGGILFAFRHIALQYIRQLNYDAYLLTRTDYAYRCEHPPFPTGNDLWVRQGENYGGYSDRYIYARSPSFMQGINITQNYLCKGFNITTNLNLEIVQKMYWESIGLRVKEMVVPAFSVRAKNDPTRWSKGDYNAELSGLGLRVKYPTELELAKTYCGY